MKILQATRWSQFQTRKRSFDLSWAYASMLIIAIAFSVVMTAFEILAIHSRNPVFINLKTASARFEKSSTLEQNIQPSTPLFFIDEKFILFGQVGNIAAPQSEGDVLIMYDQEKDLVKIDLTEELKGPKFEEMIRKWKHFNSTFPSSIVAIRLSGQESMGDGLNIVEEMTALVSKLNTFAAKDGASISHPSPVFVKLPSLPRLRENGR